MKKIILSTLARPLSVYKQKRNERKVWCTSRHCRTCRTDLSTSRKLWISTQNKNITH